MEQKDYVTFEVAKLLKKKGYDFVEQKAYLETDYHSYAKCGELIDTFLFCNIMCPIEIMCMTPTLYQAVKWMIDKHDLFVSVIYNSHDDGYYQYKIYKIGTDDIYTGTYFKNKYFSYEEALNEGILEAIKMI